MDSFCYMVERTLHRPREMIQFCTQALESKQSRDEPPPIEYRSIAHAEHWYSQERTKDIAAEYRFQYPGLLSVFEAFRSGRACFQRDELEDVCLELALGERHVSDSATWIVDQEPEALIHILWQVGFLRARFRNGSADMHRADRYFGYHQASTLSLHNADGFELHPMFQRYLDLSDSDVMPPRAGMTARAREDAGQLPGEQRGTP